MVPLTSVLPREESERVSCVLHLRAPSGQGVLGGLRRRPGAGSGRCPPRPGHFLLQEPLAEEGCVGVESCGHGRCELPSAPSQPARPAPQLGSTWTLVPSNQSDFPASFLWRRVDLRETAVGRGAVRSLRPGPPPPTRLPRCPQQLASRTAGCSWPSCILGCGSPGTLSARDPPPALKAWGAPVSGHTAALVRA